MSWLWHIYPAAAPLITGITASLTATQGANTLSGAAGIGVPGVDVPSPSMAISSAIQLADLALTWSNAKGSADLSLIDLDLASDRGLMTATILSLFTDRRAENDDVPPSGDDRDRRGWWADQFATVQGDRIGSRLWLLDRSKRTNETALRAKEYATEALAWMLEDRVVSSVDVVVEMTDRALLLSVGLERPGRDAVSFQFAHAWEHMQEDS